MGLRSHPLHLPYNSMSHLSRAATFDTLMMHRYDSIGSPTRPMFNVVSSDRNVTVLPFLRHQSTTNDVEMASMGPVQLPEKFEFPVTSEDVEGLHSFTLCLEMFANETKMVMMSIGAMNDFRSSKM
uniref:Uncharacterized protein n=1 Tax=Lygus hesperus TaxID=30085 RepID=A0A146LR03_LYGHE